MAADRNTQGTLVVAERYRDLLREKGLDSFAALMQFRGGELVKDKGTRKIIALRPGSPPAPVLYLKQHLRGSLRDAFRQILRGERPRSPAAREWNAIAALNTAGVETMEAAAFGQRRRLPWVGPSFILTADVGGRRLEDYVLFLRAKYREKRCIIVALADLARAMHSAGLAHKDFYLSHVFLRKGGPAARLALIDLQRVGRKARNWNRWVVKDLAALNYSAPSGVVTRSDRVRFLCRYLGVHRLGAREKRLAGRISRKTERIRRHDLKRIARSARGRGGGARRKGDGIHG